MNLGLGSYSFRWSIGHNGLNPDVPMTPVDLLDAAAALDLPVVQYADNMPLGELSATQLDALKTEADKRGIKIELGTQSFDAAQVDEYLDIAARLEANILRVALDGPDAEKPIGVLADEFKTLLPKAESLDVRIAIENHFNYPATQMVSLLDAISSDRVAVCLDVANSICAGEWPMETVGILAKHTINLHLKDYVIVPDPFGVGFVIHGCPLGQGRTNCRAVLDALPKDDNMSVIMEHWLPRSENMTEARALEHDWIAQSVAYAREELEL